MTDAEPAWRARKVVALAAVVFVAALVPAFATDLQLFRLTNVLVYAIALLGLNVLVGYNGQISLGHGAFYAIGAYTTAILVVHAGVAHWAAIPAAALACFVAGFLFALPVRRLGPMHLAMATFAVGAVVPILAKYKGIEKWTGGGQGMGIDPPVVPLGLALSFDQWIYLVALFTLTAAFVLAANLLRGRTGRAVLAIRDHAIAAEAMGIDIVTYKSIVFGVSAMLAGIAGALAALAIRYVGPGMFGVFLSFGLLIGIAVGGIGSLAGAIYGAIFLQFIFLVTGTTARALQTWNLWLIYGAILILFLCFNPTGVAGMIDRARAFLYARSQRNPH